MSSLGHALLSQSKNNTEDQVNSSEVNDERELVPGGFEEDLEEARKAMGIIQKGEEAEGGKGPSTMEKAEMPTRRPRPQWHKHMKKV